MTNDGWQTVRLCKLLNRALREEKVDPVKEYPLLGVRLEGHGPFLRETKTGSQISAKTLFQVKEGDFIYSRLFAWRGAFGVINKEFDDCYVSGEFPVFTVNLQKIDTHFLFYWFRIRSTFEKVLADCTGSTPLTRNRFKEEFFLSLEIPLPPLPEQKRIVARIESLAAKIEEVHHLRYQAAKEAEALLLSELSAVFNRERELRETARLEELIVEAGYGSSEKCDTDRVDEAIPVLRIPNVASERISLTNLKYARLNRRDSERLLLSKGDVLVVRTNGSLDLVGRSAVVPKLDEPFAFASYMIRLRFDRNRIAPDYAQRMLQYLRVGGLLIDFARTTAGQYNVSLGRLRAAEIPVPQLSEQRRIVAYLDELQAGMERLKRLQTETATELDALLPSILDKAFKGEL